MGTRDPFIQKPKATEQQAEEDRVKRIVREWRKDNPTPKKRGCGTCL